MLRRLHISNYVLIDSLEIDFPEGLIIITGQTGAGKSILLGALSLLMGAKADAGNISEGADSCVVEAEFENPGEEINQILRENDIEGDDDSLIIRRTLSRSGRSRSFVNDCPVQQKVLSELSSHLIDIHSQHQSLLLSDRSFQLSMLDHYSGNGELLARTASIWEELVACRKELETVKATLASLESERDYNQARFARLEAAKLREGELEELEEEQKALANAEEIKEGLAGVLESMSPTDDNIPAMDASLRDAVKTLDRLSRFLPSLQALSERLESARIELSDIESEVSDAAEGVESSQDRLEVVEQRMSQIYDLLKMYNCQDVASLIEERNRLDALLYDSSSLQDKKEELEQRLALLGRKMDDACGQLSESRKAHAGAFASSIAEQLHFLELERSVFEVSLSQAPQGARGWDGVSFLFSSTGKNPVDVARCASGGELSRIMLCLKAMMARFAKMPTMIFDEIDTGVSGSVADRMGQMICSMGQDMQVFAITHLPQVAAKGDAHYLVSKKYEEASGLTSSSISKLSGEERVMELARMLSGSDVTPEALANARVLIG